jgi:uncharacterized Tic20 family protein
MNGTSQAGNVRSWCVACHLSALAGFVVPAVGHVLGPLIVWLIKRGDSPEIDAHGKEALNFQISMLIYNLVAGVLCLLLIGFALLAVLHILNVVFVIIAALKAGEGQMYRYPLTLRLIS